MEKILQILLFIHIAAGVFALLSGIAAIVFPKGKKGHNISGKIYYSAMIGIGLTAFAIAIPKGNMFLLMIGGFSTYMTLTGYRFLQFRRNKSLCFGFWDYSLIMIGFTTLIIPSIYFTQIGWVKIGGFAVVFGVFGLILTGMLFGDLSIGKKLSTYPSAWFLQMHISRMMGAFIATVTAFLVQNWQTDPVFIAWLLPTVVFTPLIIYYQRKYKVNKQHVKKVGMHL
ncbi:hypothetical protein [Cecembia lonarensis]|uniref:DUF2306 domain-containing protein n=1 Tax=Cecembia lonarensis (strain CCUG 58316 / KCTC 22772 / LW9) TaxID=1225176 RepID=K1LYQ9_CECL9|nr:hypothetical protein [Cecembia lonarensis]EKB49229.1 hypothetical protein B879_02159 [Cecembia lonarensis LW9]